MTRLFPSSQTADSELSPDEARAITKAASLYAHAPT
jgi:hypothetical protein